MSPGAQSPSLGCPLRNPSACSGSLADSDRNSALNSFLLGLSGSRLLGEPKDLIESGHRLGADREYTSPACSALLGTSLFGNAKYEGLSVMKYIYVRNAIWLLLNLLTDNQK